MRLLPSAAAAALNAPFRFLGQLILAAGLSPAPEAALPRAVSVITGDELRQRGIDQVVDALRALHGVAINRTGGPGGLTQLRLRGTEGRLASARIARPSGHPALDRAALDHVRRAAPFPPPPLGTDGRLSFDYVGR